MTDFASINTSVADVSETDIKLGFGQCDGRSGMPLRANYFNAAFQWLCRCLVPVGGIILWSGNSASVPAGWVICDGSNETPDLSGRFVLGPSNDYAQGSTGGSITHETGSAGAHTHNGSTGEHSLTVEEIPPHSHGFSETQGSEPVVFDTGDNRSINTSPLQSQTASAGGGGGHSHDISSDGNHTHSVTELPPYVALYYIMKL